MNIRPIDDLQYSEQVRFAMADRAMSKHCFIYRLFRNIKADMVFPQRNSTSRTNRVPPDRYCRNLQTLVLECRTRKITPLFIDIPCRKGEEPPFALEYSFILRRMCDELNVPVIDVGVLSSESSWESNEEYFIDMCHFNIKGHEYLARRIADSLNALGITAAQSTAPAATTSAIKSDDATPQDDN